MGPIDFHSTGEKNTIEVNGAPQLLGCEHSSKYIHVLNNLRVSK